MLTLMLLRHAKAVPQGNGSDADRALAKPGRVDAGRLGTHLGRHGPKPSAAMVSSAKRTVETFEIVAGALGATVMVQSEDALYNATPAQMRTIMQGAPASADCLLIVGHNPGIAEAALALAASGDRDQLQRMRDRFPPCSLAVVTFDVADWQAASAGGGQLQAFLTPDDLPEA